MIQIIFHQKKDVAVPTIEVHGNPWPILFNTTRNNLVVSKQRYFMLLAWIHSLRIFDFKYKREYYKCVWTTKRPDNLQFYWHDNYDIQCILYLFRWLWVIYIQPLMEIHIYFAHKNIFLKILSKEQMFCIFIMYSILVYCFI